MEKILIITILAMLGLILGSFAGASVWRIRARQLVNDKRGGEPVDDEKEYKKLFPLTNETFKTDRSRCLTCSHELVWFDLLPLVSWLWLRGKCRYCGVRIGIFEPIMEMGLAIFFVMSYVLWPYALNLSPIEGLSSYAPFLLWLISGVLLMILFAYDLKWFLLPDSIMFSYIGVALLMASIHIIEAENMMAVFVSTIGAVGILSGLYYVLWIVSKGEWIGFGDVKLGLGLALVLSDWRLAFIALFIANVLGCLVVVPGLIVGRLNRGTRVPFGPLMILGGVMAFLATNQILEVCTHLVI